MNCGALKKIVVVLVVSGGAWTAVAQEALITDRPDFTESPQVVDRGRFQLETGMTWTDSEDTSVLDVGEALVRWGALDGAEIRIGLGSWVQETSSGSTLAGYAYPSLGLKLQLGEGDGFGFLGNTESALIVATSLPVGSEFPDSDEWNPEAVLALGWDLGADYGLGLNLGVARPDEGDGRFTSVWLSSALAIPLGEATGAFVELIAFDQEWAGGPATLALQAGIVYLLSNDLQLDARVARRLTSEGPDVLLGAGVSWRY